MNPTFGSKKGMVILYPTGTSLGDCMDWAGPAGLSEVRYPVITQIFLFWASLFFYLILLLLSNISFFCCVSWGLTCFFFTR